MAEIYPIRGIITRLTPSEKLFLATHPHLIGTIKHNADIAEAEALRRYRGQRNGPGDAFRHCYWSALLARDIGAENARQFTSAHEAWGDNPAGEKAMDLRNNSIGIGIGRSNPGASDQTLADRCARALTIGLLQTNPIH